MGCTGPGKIRVKSKINGKISESNSPTNDNHDNRILASIENECQGPGINNNIKLNSYEIQSNPTTVKNPTAQAIIERIHPTLEDDLQTKVFQQVRSKDVK